MKTKQSKKNKILLSDKIADALTVKPRADIEDDQVFGTKPKTVSRVDFNSSESEDEATISDFRKRNINLLSEISKKYEGQVVSRKDLEGTSSESSNATDFDDISQGNRTSNQADSDGSGSDLKNDSDEEEKSDSDVDNNTSSDSDGGSGNNEEDDDDDDDEEGYDISQMEEPMKETFEHMTKQNVSEDVKKGNAVRSQLLLWESLLEMRIHLQRCINTSNQMPMPDTYNIMKSTDNNEFNVGNQSVKTNVANVLDK